MSAGKSGSFGFKSFRIEPESFNEGFGAYARTTEVLDALASWNPDPDGCFDAAWAGAAAWAVRERAAGRGTGVAVAMRGSAVDDAAAADRTGALAAETSPKKRSS